MNDGGMAPAIFAMKTAWLVEKIQDKFPNAEIILVATMLPNPEAKFFDLNQDKFHDALVEMVQKEGVAVANVTDVHASLLQRKRYADMTGNNVNHTNDYLARVYAQTLFATLQPAKTADDATANESQKGNILGVLASGCNATTSLTVGITAAVAMAIALKKKKDD
jgi:hypothetical protein